jgi:signal peptidase II
MKPTLRSRLLLWGSAAVVVLADQISKVWVAHTLPFGVPSNPLPWLRPILSFTYITNTGVAFGLFPQAGDFFKVLSAAVIVGIFLFQRSLPPQDWVTHLALGLQVGGALGNLVDRFVRGSVVDFLDVNFWPFKRWAVFNLADSAIVVGVFILLLNAMWQERQAALASDPTPNEALSEEIASNG